MTHDQSEDEPQAPRAAGGGRMVVGAGVVVACVLGVGLGLWARPSAHEQGDGRMAPVSAQPEPPPKPTGKLQVVIEDVAAPIGQPLEVLSAERFGAQAVTMEPIAPQGPPAGLMKVDAPSHPDQLLVVLPLPMAEKPEPAVRPEPVFRPEPRVKAKPEPVAVKPKPQPKREKVVVAKAEKPAAKAKARTDVRVAKAEAPKRAKATAHKPVRLAKAEPPKRQKTKETEKAKAQTRLAALVRAVKATPKAIKAEVVKAERRAPRREVAKAAPPPRPQARTPVLRGEGPLRQVKNTCVSDDPGEALVCADPRLTVRERQMQRAYHDAEAAGVPAAQLRRQQQRWLAARAAAAREAPWAVEEVYEARIAELNDQSRGDRY